MKIELYETKRKEKSFVAKVAKLIAWNFCNVYKVNYKTNFFLNLFFNAYYSVDQQTMHVYKAGFIGKTEEN